nr:MAG TPA: hypothetical protein [Caudoviricetes sp.]
MYYIPIEAKHSSLTTRKRSNRPSGRREPTERHGKAWGKSNKRLQAKGGLKDNSL